MPETEDSTLAFTSAMVSRDLVKAACMRRRIFTANSTISGTYRNTMSESHGLTNSSMTIAPTMLMSDVKVSSGPWCASSEVSNRSLTMRDTMVPVFVSSKYENGSRSTCAKNCLRMSAWMRTPSTCPQNPTTYVKSALTT